MSDTQPLIINLAPTGMIPTKERTPHVPVTTEEILEDVRRCRELGAAIVHVHARGADEHPTHEKEAFAPIVSGIREIDPELIVCVSCSGRYVSDLERRSEVLELDGSAKPDMASLTLGSNNFRTQASSNSPEIIEGLATKMLERGIRPELEAFEPGMVSAGTRLLERGLLDERCFINLFLGNPGTSPLSAASLAAFQALLPAGWVWSIGGIGKFQLQANTLAIALGGHVRVGLEDNIWFDAERTELATNAALAARIAEIARQHGRPVATPREAREMLGLGAAVQRHGTSAAAPG